MQLNTTGSVTLGIWPLDDLPLYYGKICVFLRPKLLPSYCLEKQIFGSVSNRAQALCLSPCSPSPCVSSFSSEACCLQAEKGEQEFGRRVYFFPIDLVLHPVLSDIFRLDSLAFF